jgi:hypothetical protein
MTISAARSAEISALCRWLGIFSFVTSVASRSPTSEIILYFQTFQVSIRYGTSVAPRLEHHNDVRNKPEEQSLTKEKTMSDVWTLTIMVVLIVWVALLAR